MAWAAIGGHATSRAAVSLLALALVLAATDAQAPSTCHGTTGLSNFEDPIPDSRLANSANYKIENYITNTIEECAARCLAEALTECLSFELRPQGQGQQGFRCNLRSASSSVGIAPAGQSFVVYNRHIACTYRPSVPPTRAPTLAPITSAPVTAFPTRVPTTGNPTTLGPSKAPSSSAPSVPDTSSSEDTSTSFVGSTTFIAIIAVAVLLMVFAAGSQLRRGPDQDVLQATYGIGGALPLRVSDAPGATYSQAQAMRRMSPGSQQSGRGYGAPLTTHNLAYGPSAHGHAEYVGVDGWSEDGSPAGAAGYMPHSPRDPTSAQTHDPLVDELFANVRPVYVGLGAFGGQDTMTINSSPPGSQRSRYSE